MTISICDENRYSRKFLHELVSQYKQERGIPKLEILVYDSPEKLVTDLDRGAADAYLLDIVRPNGSGMELARKIRRHSHHSPIIFISPAPKSMRNAMNIHALRYFVHPKELFDMLDHTLEDSVEHKDAIYSLNTVEGRQQIRFGKIMYVERSAQVLLITTKTGRVHESVTLRESFSNKVKPLLDDARFTQTHVSFLVNFEAIDLYQKDQIIMKDGRHIPISRRYVPLVKERYTSFVS